MLKRTLSIAGKLALSALAIAAFFLISAKAPYFRSDNSALVVSAPNVSNAYIATGAGDEATISFAGEDDRFSGSFFGNSKDSGFQLQEVDLTGPCEGAGRRHLESTCPDCVITEAITEAGQPPTLFWSDVSGTNNVGTVFRDCTHTLGENKVRVPVLTLGAESLNLHNDGPASPVPRLEGSHRLSSLNMGQWHVTVDDVAADSRALESMAGLLRDSGWLELERGSVSATSRRQRVFSRGDNALCIVTLNQLDEGDQLVTMITI